MGKDSRAGDGPPQFGSDLGSSLDDDAMSMARALRASGRDPDGRKVATIAMWLAVRSVFPDPHEAEAILAQIWGTGATNLPESELLAFVDSMPDDEEGGDPNRSLAKRLNEVVVDFGRRLGSIDEPRAAPVPTNPRPNPTNPNGPTRAAPRTGSTRGGKRANAGRPKDLTIDHRAIMTALTAETLGHDPGSRLGAMRLAIHSVFPDVNEAETLIAEIWGRSAKALSERELRKYIDLLPSRKHGLSQEFTKRLKRVVYAFDQIRKDHKRRREMGWEPVNMDSRPLDAIDSNRAYSAMNASKSEIRERLTRCTCAHRHIRSPGHCGCYPCPYLRSIEDIARGVKLYLSCSPDLDHPLDANSCHCAHYHCTSCGIGIYASGYSDALHVVHPRTHFLHTETFSEVLCHNCDGVTQAERAYRKELRAERYGHPR